MVSLEKNGTGHKKLRLFTANAVIITLSIIAMAFACVYTVALSLTDTRTFANGITVDGVDISGKTISDVLPELTKKSEAAIDELSLTITYSGKEYVYSGRELGAQSDISQVLELAFSVGKSASSYASAFRDAKNAQELHSSLSVDEDTLKALLADIALEGDTPPVDAKATFDSKARSFTYEEGIAGAMLDIEAATILVSDRLKSGDYSYIELTSSPVDSECNVAVLKDNTALIAEFKTDTSANFNRNNNIALMCKYVNGYIINPGDVLSINELVGQRTAEKGFLPAPAIMDGKRLQNDLGGGICQLSGTLFNAALTANLNIIERLPHSWPSDYVDIGLDSTLDWNTQKDLKLKNESDYPIYIAAWLESKNLDASNVLHVEIYGAPLSDGITMDVHSDIIETYSPESPILNYTSSLRPGEIREITRPRTGYRTRVYRDFYFNGVLIDRELVSTSYYKPIRGEYLLGKGTKTTPTPPPVVTQYPDATPTPHNTAHPPSPTPERTHQPPKTPPPTPSPYSPPTAPPFSTPTPTPYREPDDPTPTPDRNPVA